MDRFEAVSAEEMYMLDEVTRYRGKLVAEHTIDGPLEYEFDESVEIDAHCQAAKELLGREVAAGFEDSVHVMRFIVGGAEMPSPVDLDGDGGVRELVPA